MRPLYKAGRRIGLMVKESMDNKLFIFCQACKDSLRTQVVKVKHGEMRVHPYLEGAFNVKRFAVDRNEENSWFKEHISYILMIDFQ